CLFFSSRRRHTISKRDWSSDVCSSDLPIFRPKFSPLLCMIHRLPMSSLRCDSIESDLIINYYRSAKTVSQHKLPWTNATISERHDIESIRHFPAVDFPSRMSLAHSSILFNRWLSPDFEILPLPISSPNSFKETSGCFLLAIATSCSFSGKASKPTVFSLYFIFSICLKAAPIVLFKFAVSQLTSRLTELRISLKMRTSSNLNKALCAPTIFKNCVILSASLIYTIYPFFRLSSRARKSNSFNRLHSE